MVRLDIGCDNIHIWQHAVEYIRLFVTLHRSPEAGARVVGVSYRLRIGCENIHIWLHAVEYIRISDTLHTSVLTTKRPKDAVV